MPAGPPRLVPNRRDVAHEGFEREVILIHFPSGKYFRLDAAGKVAWAAIERGATGEDVAAALAAAFEVDAAQALSTAEAFLATLVAHGLAVPGEADGAPPPPNTGAAPARATFAPPRLEVFDDLQDLFLVDPIHDVDEAGWPHVAP